MSEPKDRITVELNAWECERIVLALIQMANAVPETKTLRALKNLQVMEFELTLKIDKAFSDLLDKIAAATAK